MAKVNIETLVQDFNKALSLKCPYVSPGNTTMSTIASGVDCSGIFCAAFKHQGASIYHGSNTIWRSYLSEKGTISDTKSSNGYKSSHASDNPRKSSQLQVGMAVFKWNSSTPSKFKDGLGDYQHIGLVTSVNPLKIVHASSVAGRMTQDTSIGNWCAWGKLKACDYTTAADQEDEQTVQQEVSSSMEGTLKTKVNLNIREEDSTSSKKLGCIPAGTKVSYTGDTADGWVQVTYKNIEGYVCAKSSYITVIKKATGQDEGEDEDDDDSSASTPTPVAGAISAKKVTLQTGYTVEQTINNLEQYIEEILSRLDNIESSLG